MKKWSYVAALMLTAASGLSLTSCIDNDEPYGIEQIRVATASLLEAKKSAVNAEQAANEAAIEIKKIELQIKELEAANQKILAEAQLEIAKAQAKAIEAEAAAKAAIDYAEAQKLLAEAEYYKAEAQALKDRTAKDLEEQQEKINEYIAQAVIRVSKAQLEYDTALYHFQQEQAKNADKVTSRLYRAWEAAFQAYLDQLGVVNTLTSCYLQALKDYNRASVDLVPDGDGWKSPNKDALLTLEKAVKKVNDAIEEAQDKISKYNEVIADLQGSGLYEAFVKYEAEAKANEAALAEAQAKLAELPFEHKDLKQEISDLEAEVKAFNDNKINIPAYIWNPKEIDEAAFASIGITESVEVVPERESYTLGNEYNYNKAVANYTDLINKLKYYLMDANDVAWTQARINEMNNLLKQQQTAYEKAKADWENAKKAYNNGNEPDYSVIPMEADVEKAVAALNASSAKYTQIRKEYIEANDAYEKANEKVQQLAKELQDNPNSAANKLNAAREAFDAANAANAQAYQDAIDAAQEAYTKTTDAAYRTYSSKQLDANTKRQIYMEVYKANGYDSNVQAVKDAEKAWKDAQAAADAAYTAYTTAESDALKKQNAANLAALTTKLKADQVAQEAWDKARAAYVPQTQDPVAKDYYAAVEEAQKAYDAKEEAYHAYYEDPETEGSVTDKLSELVDAFNKQDVEVGGGWSSVSLSKLSADIYKYMRIDDESYDFPVAVAPSHLQVDGVYVNVKQYLINMSAKAYGELGVNYDRNNGIFEYDEAFLIDAKEITPAMVNEYIKAKYPADDEFDYFAYYDLFGAYGQTLYTQNRIDVATAMINNQKLLSESIEPLKAGLAALEEGNEAAKKDLKALEYSLEDKNAEYKEYEDQCLAEVNKLNAWKVEYANVLSNLTDIIAQVEENGDLAAEGLVNKYIKSLENQIDELQKKIDGEYKDKLAYAEYQLKQYTDHEGVMTANPEQINLDMAWKLLDDAQKYLAILEARANELEAKYKASIQ